MNRPWLFLILAGAIAGSGTPLQLAQAQSVYPIEASHAQGLTGDRSPVISIWPGYGTNLSFLATDETIVRAWIDDPSRVTLDFDEPLCPMAIDSDCEAGQPAVIHLRRIEGLEFEHLSQAGGTLLTVITEAPGEERQLYEFRIEFAVGEPGYHTVTINPTSPLSSPMELMDVQRGVLVAESRNLISPEQDLWNRLQRFLALARDGTAVTTAAQQSGISLELVTQLAQWGAGARDEPIVSPASL